MTPVAKFYTGKMAVAVISEVGFTGIDPLVQTTLPTYCATDIYFQNKKEFLPYQIGEKWLETQGNPA